MPELPEVDTLVKELNTSSIIGTKIIGINVSWRKTVESNEFERNVLGQYLVSISRRAKYIILQLSRGYLLIHLRMTGRFSINLPEPQMHERVSFILSNNKVLRFIDVRKFGRIIYAENLDALEQKLGPEPLDASFTWQKLKQMLSRHSTQLKALLLNQRFISGLGNIYVDEALWLAKLHPLRKANTLNNREIQSLFTAIQTALKLGLLSNGATLGSGKTNFYRLDGSKGRHIYQLNVFRQTGKNCKRCGNVIAKIKAAGRSTHICSQCQKP